MKGRWIEGLRCAWDARPGDRWDDDRGERGDARATTLGSRTSGPTLLEIGLQRADGGGRSRVAASSQRGERGGRRRSDALQRTLPLDGPVDLRTVLGALAGAPGTHDAGRVGSGDSRLHHPCRAWIDRAAGGRQRDPGACRGPWAALLLDGLPALLGLDDDDTGFEPGLHPTVAELARRRGRPRLGRTGAVWEALLPAILEQRITGTEAWRNYRRLVRWHGNRAPGLLALLAAPAPADVLAIPPAPRGRLGIEPRPGGGSPAAREARLEAIGAAARARRRRAGADLAAALRTIPGIGPRTAAEVTLRALGDPDAVSVGDAHLSNLVTFALTGRPRGTDEEMLGLLAPWAGHRARVVRLLEGAGIAPPRYGPRVAPRDLPAT